MRLSFHDEPSLVEAVGSLQFAADHPNPIVEWEASAKMKI